jgi:CRP-like cAMP-binding protein
MGSAGSHKSAGRFRSAAGLRSARAGVVEVGSCRLPVRLLDRWATPVDLPAGAELTHAGGLGREVFLLLTGRVEVRDPASGAPIAVLGPGDLCGELAMLGDRRRAATAVAVEATEALVMTPGEFAALQEASGEFAALVATQVAAHRDV